MLLKRLLLIVAFIVPCVFLPGCQGLNHQDTALGEIDTESVLHSEVTEPKGNFLSEYEPLNIDGTINVVVEIPAGTNEKWEVDKLSGELLWTLEKNKYRIVNYLPYPGNYGMIPRTLMPKSLGGDGDPLDVIVLGPHQRRGTILKAEIIGVLQLRDRGEEDSKLIAVPKSGKLSLVKSLNDLDRDYSGISQIIELWFKNYKGAGKIESLGYADKAVAESLLFDAIQFYSLTH
jgi:inorganic pyrophosphatase